MTRIVLRPYQVRAALAGTLEMVVLPVKPQPRGELLGSNLWDQFVFSSGDEKDIISNRVLLRPPFRPGQRVYGAETWAYHSHAIHIYAADNLWENVKWKSATCMPASASRFHFTVTSVACGMVKDMTEEEIIKMGGMEHVKKQLFEKLKNKIEPQCWLSHDHGPSYCTKCATKEAIRLNKSGKYKEKIFIDGGYYSASLYTDGFETCETCGKVLDCIPNDYEYYLMQDDGTYIDGKLLEEELYLLLRYREDDMTSKQINKELFRATWIDRCGDRYPWESTWGWKIGLRREE